MSNLLLVEDEDRLRKTLSRGLSDEGFRVTTAADGNAGRRLASAGGFDCLILDLMLPGLGGLEILKSVRAAGDRTPAIILTARRSVGDRVLGLDSGADDYLTKPFAFDELLARIRVCLRRSADPPEPILVGGELRLDIVHHRLHRGRDEIELTAREFALLEYFLRHRGETLSRDRLAREVWRDPAATMTNVIEVYVKYLRDKIDGKGGPHHIRTVRGRGYCWQDNP